MINNYITSYKSESGNPACRYQDIAHESVFLNNPRLLTLLQGLEDISPCLLNFFKQKFLAEINLQGLKAALPSAQMQLSMRILQQLLKQGLISSLEYQSLSAHFAGEQVSARLKGGSEQISSMPATSHPQLPAIEQSSQELLWKPVSDSNGKLVVLLPANSTSKVASLSILSADGKRTLAKGQFSGVANGGRAHFRFQKQGGEFPANCILQLRLKDGSSEEIRIKSPQARLELRGGK